MMFSFLNTLKEFARDERATLSVEAAVISPILIMAYGGMYVFWDAFKMRNINVKAAYTISDMVSREIVNITPEYIDGLSRMLDFLNRAKYESRLRVSVVGAIEDPVTGDTDFILCWSKGRGMAERTDMNGGFSDEIPIMAAGTEVIVIETETDYVPILGTNVDGERLGFGLSNRTFENTIVTRPRFIRGQMGFDDGVTQETCTTAAST
jgi:hypothetical protein